MDDYNEEYVSDQYGNHRVRDNLCYPYQWVLSGTIISSSNL